MNVTHHSNALTRYLLPYCIKELKGGRWIVLNRKYKPLGTFSAQWVDYESHHSAFKPKNKITIDTLLRISIRGRITEDKGLKTAWLYEEIITDWKWYMNRVQLLMTRIVNVNDND